MVCHVMYQRQQVAAGLWILRSRCWDVAMLSYWKLRYASEPTSTRVLFSPSCLCLLSTEPRLHHTHRAVDRGRSVRHGRRAPINTDHLSKAARLDLLVRPGATNHPRRLVPAVRRGRLHARLGRWARAAALDRGGKVQVYAPLPGGRHRHQLRAVSDRVRADRVHYGRGREQCALPLCFVVPLLFQNCPRSRCSFHHRTTQFAV